MVLGNSSGLLTNDQSPINALAASSPTLQVLVAIFSIAAIVTSFWGAAFSTMIECTHLLDAAVTSGQFGDLKGRFPLADDSNSIKAVAEYNGMVKAAASTLVLVPPALVSVACPDSFLSALQYTGIYVDPLLYGIAPAVMAWRLRSREGHQQHIPGGNATLMSVALLTGGYTLWQTFVRFM